jgi:hypothetical protein
MPSINAPGYLRYVIYKTGLFQGQPLTLVQTVDDASGFQELQTLQERLDSKIRVCIVRIRISIIQIPPFHHGQLYKEKRFVLVPAALALINSDLGVQFRLSHLRLI